MADNILEIKNLTKVYPGVVALNKVSFDVRRGEVLGIVGENGAGKSTLIKSIAGAITPEEGTICFDGKEYTHLTPHLSSEVGIGVVYQEFNLVPALSVSENIFLGNYIKTKVGLTDFKEMHRRSEEVMDRIGVHIPPEKMVWLLTVGHQQIVEILRSLVKDVKLLILDEPTAPLTVAEVEQLYEIIRSLKAQGITIIYISHRLEEIFDLTDRIVVLRDGEFVTTLDTADATRDQLIHHMVGREVTTEFPPRETPIGEEVLRAEHLTGNGVEDINFTLHKGEILGFAGLLGCGRTETMQLVFGAAKRTGGKVFVNGEEAHIRNTTDGTHYGIGFVPEDRKRSGAFLYTSIKWNIAIGSLKKLLSGLVVSPKKEAALAEEYGQKLRIKTPSMEQWVCNLSGGNQQKVVVAKVLAADMSIMIFDEPTRGIDVGAKQEMYKLIRQLSEEGKSIIMISSEMNEVIGLSDRIVVMSEGQQMGILEREDFTQERILSLASGIKG